MVTPFRPDGSIDFDSYKKLIERIIQHADFLVPLGTTGEAPALSGEEKKKIFEFTIEVNNGRLPVVAGIGGNNTAEVIRFMEDFNPEGFSAILSVSPYYNKPSQEGIYQHYYKLAEQAPLPLLIYNVPARTGSNVQAGTTLRLAEHPNIIGVKEASGDFEQCMKIIRNMPADFLFLSGDDAVALPIIAIGGHGLISVIGNAFPKETTDMVHSCLRNDYETARKLNDKLMEIVPLLFEEGSPAGIKEVLEALKLCSNTLRLPLVSVSASLSRKIKQAVNTFRV